MKPLSEAEVERLRAAVGWKPEWQSHMVKGGDSPLDARRISHRHTGRHVPIKTAQRPTKPRPRARCGHCPRFVGLTTNGRVSPHMRGMTERCPGSLGEPRRDRGDDLQLPLW